MAEFRWIKTSLFLILLQFTAAATGQRFISITFRDRDEVTLPCNNVIDGQKNCDSTAWFFNDSRSRLEVVLVTDGKIVEEAKDKSDRLSVSENCSLVIKKVRDEDAGLYACRQIRSGQQGPGAVVYLSVVTMTENKNTDEVTVSCSVSTFEPCRHKVKWLFEGPDNRDMTTSLCLATASFSTSHFISMKLLKCEVNNGYTGEVKVFPFSVPQTSSGWSVLDYMMLVLRVAELLLMTVIVVLLIRAQRNRRPPDRNTVQGDGDGHEATVNYENVGDPSVSVRFP